MLAAQFSPFTLTIALSHRGRGNTARPGIPRSRHLRFAKGAAPSGFVRWWFYAFARFPSIRERVYDAMKF